MLYEPYKPTKLPQVIVRYVLQYLLWLETCLFKVLISTSGLPKRRSTFLSQLILKSFPHATNSTSWSIYMRHRWPAYWLLMLWDTRYSERDGISAELLQHSSPGKGDCRPGKWWESSIRQEKTGEYRRGIRVRGLASFAPGLLSSLDVSQSFHCQYNIFPGSYNKISQYAFSRLSIIVRLWLVIAERYL